MQEHKASSHHEMHHYRRLAVMAVLSFVAMYVLMYAMVDTLANVYSNLNQFYMAGLMAAPMVIIELAVMDSMYPDKRMNIIVGAISLLVAISFFAAIRAQAAIGDGEFLKSMIPHHGGAVLMCKEAPISDTEIQALCKNIIASQEAEIAQMKAILARD